jgi:hypothetical protein
MGLLGTKRDRRILLQDMRGDRILSMAAEVGVIALIGLAMVK